MPPGDHDTAGTMQRILSGINSPHHPTATSPATRDSALPASSSRGYSKSPTPWNPVFQKEHNKKLMIIPPSVQTWMTDKYLVFLRKRSSKTTPSNSHQGLSASTFRQGSNLSQFLDSFCQCEYHMCSASQHLWSTSFERPWAGCRSQCQRFQPLV